MDNGSYRLTGTHQTKARAIDGLEPLASGAGVVRLHNPKNTPANVLNTAFYWGDQDTQAHRIERGTTEPDMYFADLSTLYVAPDPFAGVASWIVYTIFHVETEEKKR